MLFRSEGKALFLNTAIGLMSGELLGLPVAPVHVLARGAGVRGRGRAAQNTIGAMSVFVQSSETVVFRLFPAQSACSANVRTAMLSVDGCSSATWGRRIKK